MKNAVLLTVILFFSMVANSQEIWIRDQTSLEPLDLVTILSIDPPVSMLTDARGRADMTNFKNVSEIHFRRVGYQTLVFGFQELERMKFRIFMEPRELALSEVVISATRWEHTTTDLPNKITTIKPASISMQNPQTAADLLGSSGEVYIQKSQLGGGSPMIRGFSTNRILLSVDGVRMNTAIFRSGNLQNVINIDPLTIEKAEVVFGPGSVIYGSDAIGGVMSFHTLQPKLSSDNNPLIKGGALVRWSSANQENTAHVDLNLGYNKWGSVTSLTYNNYGDLRMGKFGPEEYLRPKYGIHVNGIDSMAANPDPRVQMTTGYSQINLMQKILFKPNDHWEFDYGFHYSNTSDYSRYDRLIRYKGGNQQSGEWYYGPQKWIMNALNVTHYVTHSIFDNFHATLAMQNFEESRHDRDWNKTLLRHRTERVNALSLNADFEKEVDDKNELYYGMEAVIDLVQSTGEDEDISTDISVPGPARYPDPSSWQSYAAYLNYRHKPVEKLSVQTGLRYNQVLLDATFDNRFYPFPFANAHLNTGALTGSLGLAWSPGTQWQINLNLSSGFRAPNVDDVGKVFDSEPGSVVVPNPDLKSEYVWNGEITVIRIIREIVKVDLTGYYTYLNHALVRRDFTLNGLDSILYDGEMSRVQAVQNAAFATVYGIQAGVEVKLPAGFSFSSRINYQKGTEELDNGITAPLRHAAPWFGVSRLIWSQGRIRTELYAMYNSQVSFDNLAPEERGKSYLYAIDVNGNPYSPAWYTINCKALFQATDYLSISAGIENITNQRYRPYSSGIVAAGVNLIVSLRATF